MKLFITVAPASYSGNADADFICSGKNDELTIQKAVDKCIEENKNVMLLS